jgi:hypothetical protein
MLYFGYQNQVAALFEINGAFPIGNFIVIGPTARRGKPIAKWGRKALDLRNRR